MAVQPIRAFPDQPLLFQPLKHHGLCVIPDIHPDPLPLKPFGGDERRGATREGIERDVTLLARCLDDSFKQGQRLLGWVAGAFS